MTLALVLIGGCTTEPGPWQPVPPQGAEQLYLSDFYGLADADIVSELLGTDGSVLPPEVDVSGACGAPVIALAGDALARCSADTKTCVDLCFGDADCIDGCLRNDVTPAASDGRNCAACIEHQRLSCIDQTCHESVAQYQCCVPQRCAPGSPADCAETSCGIEKFALDSCAIANAFSCVVEITAGVAGACFPTPPI